MAEVLQQSDGIISFDILLNGSKIKDTVEVQEISIEMEVNRISSAVIVMQDGGAIGVENAPYTNSDGSDFLPGTEIEIKLGHDDDRNTVFKGIITSHRLSVKQDEGQLEIICKDKAINLTKGRFNAIYQDKKDSDVIKSIVGKYGLTVNADATTVSHPTIVQYNCSDWDFLIIRSEMNNMVVTTLQNEISVKKYDFSTEPQFEVNAGQFVKDIDLRIHSEELSGTYEMTSWSEKEQKVTTVKSILTDSLGQGNLTGKKLSGILSNSSNSYTSSSLPKDELTAWGDAQVSMAVVNKIQGKIVCPGTTSINAGDMVELSGFSSRFNGKTYISGVSHQLRDGEWFIELSVGRTRNWHASLPDIADINASGLIPSTSGLQIAKVKQIQEDPDNNYRVLVTLPSYAGTGQQDGVWARMSFPYASNNAGFFFYPEVGDEVIVNFVNNDPRYPVITGSVYSAKNKPKETADKKNQFKSIYTKSGIKMVFDDEDKILTIETPGGNSMIMDDKNKSINFKDITGNTVDMDSEGITLKSPKTVTINATEDIVLKATGSISMNATADVKVDGTNVQQSAKAAFTAKGNASAELSAAGQTTVKGAMVMIN